ncbi:MAG: hypothetical protein AAGG55_03775 [Pseudomonadota bacterium]
MADVTSLYGDQSTERFEKRRKARAESFAAVEVGASQLRSGFSARLNMLCSLAGERELGRGRLEDLCELNEKWVPSDVQAWLTSDWVPGARDLDMLVRFLCRSLEGKRDSRLWEAFLLYGSEHVANPLLDIASASDAELTELASRVLLEITREHRIAPSSYDVDQALADTVSALKDLNVTSAREELQPGHRQVIATRVFGSSISRR